MKYIFLIKHKYGQLQYREGPKKKKELKKNLRFRNGNDLFLDSCQFFKILTEILNSYIHYMQISAKCDLILKN